MSENFGWKIVFKSLHFNSILLVGSVVTSWLLQLSPDQAVRVQTLAGDIALCSCARHFTLTVPLSTQEYKWLPANLTLRVTMRWTNVPPRRSRNIPNHFMLQKP